MTTTFSTNIMDIDFDSLDVITTNINNWGWDDVWAENIGMFEIDLIVEFMKNYYGKTVIVTFIHNYIRGEYSPICHFNVV